MKAFFATLVILFFIAPIVSWAQFAEFQNNASITLSPSYPEAKTETTVTLDAYSLDTVSATIDWFIDGEEVLDAKNLRSFTLTTKGIGEPTNVVARLKLRNGEEVLAKKTITPARVDLVVEADTLVPTFYQGRALPSFGSTVRIVATPVLGNNTPPSSLSYLWKHDNKVLFGGPITGKSVGEFTLGIGRNQTVSVTVMNASGATVAYKSIVITPTEPEIIFYEENPLRGASEQALSDGYQLIGQSTTLRAEPYYMARSIFNANPLLEWSLNGYTINNPSTDPQYITLEKGELTGSLKIGFHIRNLNQLLQGAKEEIDLFF